MKPYEREVVGLCLEQPFRVHGQVRVQVRYNVPSNRPKTEVAGNAEVAVPRRPRQKCPVSRDPVFLVSSECEIENISKQVPSGKKIFTMNRGGD